MLAADCVVLTGVDNLKYESVKTVAQFEPNSPLWVSNGLFFEENGGGRDWRRVG
jgi:hypothetical protein